MFFGKILKYSIAIILANLYFIAILFSWQSYPELKLWKFVDISLNSFYFSVTLFRIIHLSLGILFFIYGIINVIEIIAINRKAQLRKNQPGYIIRSGLYGKMRHPMYSMIIIMQASLFFSLCSALGVLFSIIFLSFFMLLGLYEEKFQLLPIFGENYRDYMKEVKMRFFPIFLKIYLVSIYFLSFIGLFL